jgi:hypothetical protein
MNDHIRYLSGKEWQSAAATVEKQALLQAAYVVLYKVHLLHRLWRGVACAAAPQVLRQEPEQNSLPA